MQRLVVDTNVIISALLTPNGESNQILNLITDGKVTICYNAEILNEYKEVMARSKFGFSPDKQRLFIKKVNEIGVVLIGLVPSDLPLPDESDRAFYDTAKASKAILVTYNTKHFPSDDFVMTPGEYLQRHQ